MRASSHVVADSKYYTAYCTFALHTHARYTIPHPRIGGETLVVDGAARLLRRRLASRRAGVLMQAKQASERMMQSWGKRQQQDQHTPLRGTSLDLDDFDGIPPVDYTPTFRLSRISLLFSQLAGPGRFFINKHGGRWDRWRIQHPSHRSRAPIYHPRGCTIDPL